MWARLDDALIDHRKIWTAGALIGRNGPAVALGMFSVGLMWTNKHLTDGFLPDEVVLHFRHVDKPKVVAGALAAAQLWDRVEGGYRVHDFHDHNPSADDVKANREWDRRRKALYSDPELIAVIRQRDQDRCRYCGRRVSWKDRRGPLGGQYDHVIPRGDNSLDNIVTTCRGCNQKKKGRTPEEARMRLLPPPAQNQNGNGTSSDLDST